METSGGKSEEPQVTQEQGEIKRPLRVYTIVGKYNWSQAVCLMIHKEDDSPLDIEDPDNSIITGFYSPSRFAN